MNFIPMFNSMFQEMRELNEVWLSIRDWWFFIREWIWLLIPAFLSLLFVLIYGALKHLLRFLVVFVFFAIIYRIVDIASFKMLVKIAGVFLAFLIIRQGFYGWCNYQEYKNKKEMFDLFLGMVKKIENKETINKEDTVDVLYEFLQSIKSRQKKTKQKNIFVKIKSKIQNKSKKNVSDFMTNDELEIELKKFK